MGGLLCDRYETLAIGSPSGGQRSSLLSECNTSGGGTGWGVSGWKISKGSKGNSGRSGGKIWRMEVVEFDQIARVARYQESGYPEGFVLKLNQMNRATVPRVEPTPMSPPRLPHPAQL